MEHGLGGRGNFGRKRLKGLGAVFHGTAVAVGRCVNNFATWKNTEYRANFIRENFPRK